MNEFIERFMRIVKTYPSYAAISIDNQQHLSYADLEFQARKLAEKLIQYDMEPGHLVALNIAKSTEYLIALLAVWMTGAAFVPVDPNLPEARRNFFLNQAKPNLIIDGCFNLTFQHALKLYPEQLAYIVFTSGSTGQPKGVMVSHAGIVNVLEQQIKAFQLKAGDRALFYLSIQFDASISDLGTAFLSGATLCLTSADPHYVAVHLAEIVTNNAITHMDIPPSLLATLNSDEMPDTVTTIIIGGEVCPLHVVKQWSKKYRLMNVYGPTEATICTSMEWCSPERQSASIGQAIEQITYHIFDAHLQPATEGELYISGIGLALGYLNNPELTQEKFIQLDNKIYYKTGDWVRKQDSGHYIYLGRIDRQVKIRGQLVEPEEIEAVLCEHPAVSAAAVISLTEATRNQLLAFIETTPVTVNILLHFLKSRVPSWMIPNRIIMVDKIPKNEHGKVDYNALSTMEQTQTICPDVPVNQPIAQKLQSIWQEVLHLAMPPSIHAHLFEDLGATSLDIIQIIVRAERHNLYFSTEMLHHLPTIYDVTLWLQCHNTFITEALAVSVLKKECQGPEFPKATLASQSNHLFMTGATGFLGIHLLEQLLEQTTNPIICLIRAQDSEQARHKLAQAALKYQCQINSHDPRIQIVVGDLAQFQLGLHEEQWNQLAKTIGTIYHCAAEVNMVKTFAELKPINVEGTKEIARLACHVTLKKLYYISTLSVFVASDQNSALCKEEKLEKTRYVYGGYAQSKWAAEYFLQNSGLDVAIFRPGLVTGHSQSGVSSEHDYLALFVQGLKAIGTLPFGDWDSIHVDATPVNYAARAIVHLSLTAQERYFHIVNNKPFSLALLIKVMQKYGIQLNDVGQGNWLKNCMPDAVMAASYMALCRLLPQQHTFERFRTMDLFQATNVVFEQKNTLKNLVNTDISCPPADEALLNKYVARIIDAIA